MIPKFISDILDSFQVNFTVMLVQSIDFFLNEILLIVKLKKRWLFDLNVVW
jgi:hypothetical protein